MNTAQKPDTCWCRCDTCIDSECHGHVCKAHDVDRWVVVSPFMAHPLPTDFESRQAAEEFISQYRLARLIVQQVTDEETP